MNPLLFAPVLDVAGKVFDRLFPDKQAAERAKAEFAAQAAQMDASEVNAFRDFVVAYEGRGEAVHPALQLLRGSVRPVVTYILAGLYGYGFLHPNDFPPEVTQGLFQLNLISLGFWYGERALKNLGLSLGRKS